MKLFSNWAWTESNWALGLKHLSFKMRPSMCQKSHVTCIIFYSIFSHCWVLLLVLHELKKLFPLLNSHRQIMSPKILEQITQEFLFLPLWSSFQLSFFRKSSNKSSMLSIAPKLLLLKSSQHHYHYHFNLPLKNEHLIISCHEKKFTQMTGLIWPLLTLINKIN